MKQILYLLICLSVLAWTAQGCSDDNKSETPPAPEEPAITFPTGSDTQPVFTTEGGTSTLTFTATEAWTASVGEADTRAIDWLTVSPTSGQAGTATLTITTEPNNTYDERNAAITLTSGGTRKTLTVTQKQRDALTVTSNKVELEATGGDFAIELQANVSVSYEIEESAKAWLTPASDTRALTTTTLHFQAAANEDLQPRQGIITLNGGNGLTEDVTVYQLGSRPVLILTQDEYLVGSDGETIKVELKSNNTYQIEMPSVDWITKADTRALSTYTHYFIVAPNDTYDAREAVIRFVDEENGLKDSVKVVQVQKDAIILAKNNYEVSGAGETLNFSIQANVDFTVSTNVDWIAQTNTRGLTEYPLSFTISPNDSDNPRTGIITIADANNNRQEITVEQTGKIDYEKIEREALIEFYKAAGGDDWEDNTNWCSDKPLNEWYGVNLDSESNHVSALWLGGNALKGDIANIIHPLCSLRELTCIDFPANPEIYGDFPDEIYSLTKLKHINIDSNLGGELSSKITNLRNLNQIWLRRVKMSHSVFKEICTSLADLEVLSLYLCELNAPIPSEIKNLTHLWNLTLDGSDVVGELPDAIWELPLRFINLSRNETLTGHISPNIGKLKDLSTLSLDFCSFNGEIPDEITQCTNLEYLWLRDNQIEGEIPQDIGNLQKLIELDLQENNLTGTLPSSMSRMDNLVACILSGNRLSGEVPQEVSSMWQKWNPFNSILPQQEGYKLTYESLYTSTDYSKDGEVQLLQRHTEGKGIPVILMGDAFVDKHMEEGGYYDRVMQRAMEAFFSVEPMISLRPLFDVYSVRVVSENDYIGANTALSTWHYCGAGGDEDLSKCMEYASLAVNDLKDVSIHIIMNDQQQIGVTAYLDDNCTISLNSLFDSGVEWQNFEAVFRHEAIGHGFGLLGDEYTGYIDAIDEEGKASLRASQALGRDLNLDITNDEAQILWSKFLADDRYADENLGIYEGGWASYSYGVYRPSFYSIMRYNEPAFNAPSREAIYKRAMRLAYGSSWTYDYEDFVEFDAPSRNAATTRSLRQAPSAAQVEKWKKSHRPPVRVKGTWRDARKNNIVVPYR